MAPKPQIPENYPRIPKGNPEAGLLDLSLLKPLPKKIDEIVLKSLIETAIKNASVKASKEALDIEEGLTHEQLQKVYKKSATSLFEYFKRSDPAGIFQTAEGKNCKEFAVDLVRKRQSHNATMNAGWRYQFLFVECAQASNRFKGVSDVNTGDADVNLTAEIIDGSRKVLSILVSMKNRSDTISGSKWGGAISKLEDAAKNDKNKTGVFCCVFALGMDSHRFRRITRHSVNTEIWPANVVWPFVSGYSYEEMMLKVSEVLAATHIPDFILPPDIANLFALLCKKNKLIDENDIFNSKENLIKWLCS